MTSTAPISSATAPAPRFFPGTASEPHPVTMLRPLRLKLAGDVLATGTSGDVTFGSSKDGDPDPRNWRMQVQMSGHTFLTQHVEAFFARPSLRELEEWVNDGVCETPLGNRTEPDGIDEEGAPSWLLILGMI